MQIYIISIFIAISYRDWFIHVGTSFENLKEWSILAQVVKCSTNGFQILGN